MSVGWWSHRKHEEGVEHESHSGEGLDGGHHVPLQTQREDDEERHSDQQQHAKTEGHLKRRVSHDKTLFLHLRLIITTLTAVINRSGCLRVKWNAEESTGYISQSSVQRLRDDYSKMRISNL